MCDYSLHHVSSRPAKVADKLVTMELANKRTWALPPSVSSVPSW